jgi:DNA helicase-2/ATP-dependent DNA helicase PcrA
VPVVKLDELNPPQREAVTTVDGPLLVLAGAGSGKTRVITYRVAHLLDRRVAPGEILAVSFTNKAAEEMKERVGRLVGRRGREVHLSTFHSLGLAILKSEKQALGRGGGFTIYDASDQLGVLRELCRRTSMEERRFDLKAIQFRISLAKNAFLTPEQMMEAADATDEYDLIAADLYPKYQAALAGYHAFDFDDLICAPVRLFERDPGALARWQARFRYVMVDEYQDTNRAQFLLLEKLVAPHGNVCVVGDDDQSIYGWRGAEATHILEFDRHFPGARIVKLEENYRSTPFILDCANAVIAHNRRRHGKRLHTQRTAGERPKLVVTEDAEAEARFVAEEIALLNATRGYKLSDCAILYRSNIQARAFEEALRAQRISYKVIGGTAFFDRREVKDAIAYLKLALHPRDEISLRRIINYPARGIGATTVERLAAYAATERLSLFDACVRARSVSLFDAAPAPEGAPVEDLAERARASVTAFCDLVDRGRALLHGNGGLRNAAKAYLNETGLFDEITSSASSGIQGERRLHNVEGLLDALDRFEQREGRDLGAFLQRISLDSKDDQSEESADVVTLCTLHGAKGLEFPVVFLVGLEEELLPHKRTLYPQGPDAGTSQIDLDEERRLFYVGITRAREHLYLSRARYRTSRATPRPRTPSRFLEEIPAELCEVRDAFTAPALSPEDEDAFARAALEKMLKMTE